MLHDRLELTSNEKRDVFKNVESYLFRFKLDVVKQDSTRPWGGFFVLKEDQADEFRVHFFPEEKLSDLYKGSKLSPKILLVQPGKRLSWQYHHRRAEIWKVVAGTVGVVTSDSDEEGS